jgi:NADH-quinone oxidoreductase subunit J
MVFQDVIFWVLAVGSVAAALGVVLLKDIFRAALLLVVVFLAVAGFFVMMNAEFLAVVQVLIYAGAIAILIIFAITLTREVQQGNLPNRLQPAAVLFPVLLLAALVFVAVDTNWNLLEDQPQALQGGSGKQR